MGKRTGRPRGAPIGNTNRLKHGRFSARRIRRRAEVNVLLRRCRNLTRKIEMMGWSRKALRMKMASAASAQIVIPGEHGAQSAPCEGREPNFLLVSAARKLGSLPSVRARARASPGMTGLVQGVTQRHATTMTNRQQTAMPFAGKLAMACA